MELGHGVAGKVGLDGQTMNIPDAYECPDLFDPSHDRKTNYRTKSILCMPLHDRDGYRIGVLQAINKIGVPSIFDDIDEKMLQLLLALTAQQLRVCELISEKEKASHRVDATLSLVETICRTSDLTEATHALARATKHTLACQRAFVFMRDQDSLVCRATAGCGWGEVESLRLALTDPVVGTAVDNRRTLLLDRSTNPEELNFLEERLPLEHGAGAARAPASEQPGRTGTGVRSALCCPLHDLQSGELFGVILAVNRLITVSDVKEAEGELVRADARRGSALGFLLRTASTVSEFHPTELGPFLVSDLEQLQALVQLAGQFVQGRHLYDNQRRSTRKLEALLSLFTEASAAQKQRDAKAIASLILDKGLAMFECDRCTFFTVDHLNGEFLGYFQAEGGNSGQLQELRVPMQGIAGCVAETNQMLNIRDAWSDARFSNKTDLKTGYRTRTLLCAPLTSSSGKVIAVLQCINKLRGEFFGAEDERMLMTVSGLLSDMLQRMVLESTYEAFIKSNDAIDSDVKDMFRSYQQDASGPGATGVDRDRSELPADSLTSPSVDRSQAVVELLRWDFSHERINTEESNKLQPYITTCFLHLNLLTTFGISTASLDGCVQAMKLRYSYKAVYHNWAHAFSTLHATFLMLTSRAWARLLPAEDRLALLIAALGHDVEHPGFTNAFLVNTRHQLAIRYNDLSVLESHHAATTCGILASDPSFFECVTAESQRRVRLVIVSSILATDMAKHQECITWLESKTAEVPSVRSSGGQLKGEDALSLGKAILHSADLVHPALPWRVHRHMSLLIATEFFNQFQEEQRLGLPTLPFMGKDPSSLNGLAPIQMGFIQFVAAPLWSAMNFAAGEDCLGAIMRNVEQNRKVWQQLGEGKDVPIDQPFENLPAAELY